TNGTDRRRERLVLRRQQTANAIFREPDVLREGRVLRGLAEAPRVPVPEVYWWESSPAALGAPFFVMAAVPGHVPAGRPSIHVLGWGDARVGNMIFGDEHTVVAAIDWEVASIGPPAIDVAHWLFFDEFATHACGIEPLPGWPDRATTVARYEALSGRSLDDLE